MKITLGSIGAMHGAEMAVPVAAQPLLQDWRVLQSCSMDVVRLCSGTLHGEGRVEACIRENMAHLSPGCVDAMLAAALLWSNIEIGNS